MSVYFITCREIGRVKIGHASHAMQRFHGIQTACPFDLRLEAEMEGGVEIERELHQRFSGVRGRGEWFTLTPEIDELIAASQPKPEAQTDDAGNLVTRLLARFNISQYALATRLGVDQATVSRLATGKTPLNKRTEMALGALERELSAA